MGGCGTCDEAVPLCHGELKASIAARAIPGRRRYDSTGRLLFCAESKATNPAYAGIQAIRLCCGNDLRNRVGREDQEGAVQDRQSR